MKDISRDKITETLPHREPFLFLDKIVECVSGKSCIGEWTPEKDWNVFDGHFPQQPVVPGVLLTEALAQCGAFCILTLEEYAGKIAYLARVTKMKFIREVFPDDKVKLNVNIERLSKIGGRGYGVAEVGGNVVCEGELSFAFLK